MAFTITDFHDLVRLLEQHEEWRKELRRLLLTDELLNLPNAFRELHKLVDRRFAELAEAQRRTEEALAAHRAETDRRFAELAEALRNLSETFTAHRQEFLEYRAETDRRFAELAEAQRRTEEALAAHRAETDRRFAELAEALRNLSETFTAHRQEFLEYRAETDRRFAELAEAQRRHYEEFAAHRQEFVAHRQEFLEYRAETERRFAELAEAQRRHYEEFAAHRQEFVAHRQEFLEYRAETERRFAELAEAQRRHYEEFAAHRQEFVAHRQEFLEYRAETERRFAELAEAQRRTEETLRQVLLRQEQFQRTLDRFGQTVGVTVEGQMVEAVQRYLAERGYVLLEPIATLAIDRIGELDGIARVRGPDGEEAWLLISVKARLGPRAVHDFADLLRNAAVQEALRAYGVRGPVLPLIFGVVLDRRALELAREARIGLLLQAQGELVAPQPWTLEASGGSEDP
jgi:GGDEF domain-containing protein